MTGVGDGWLDLALLLGVLRVAEALAEMLFPEDRDPPEWRQPVQNYVEREPFPHYDAFYWEQVSAEASPTAPAPSPPPASSDTAPRPTPPEELSPDLVELKAALRASDRERSADS